MRYIIGVRNNSGGCVGHYVQGYGKITMWNNGDVLLFKDKEGNIVPLEEKAVLKGLLDVRLTPIYDEVKEEVPQKPLKRKAEVSEKPSNSSNKPEVEQFSATEFNSPIESGVSAIQKETGDPLVDSVNQPFNGQLRESDSSSEWNCFFSKETSKWILRKDGFESTSPIGIKMHVKAAFGKEFVENINWIR